MSPLAILVLSLGLSADAFAAAIGRGAAQRPGLTSALRSGLVFGTIEALTPLLGWWLGLAASGFVAAVDHWIAFALLTGVGGKMIVEATLLRDPERNEAKGLARRGHVALVATAVGTSIDAAAIGVSLALLQVNILAVAVVVGLTTFLMATLGMLLGRAAGDRLGGIVELVGGLGLCLLGLAILAEHTGVLALT